MQPSWCEATVICTGVTGPSDYLSCQELDENGQVSWQFDGTDYQNGLTPGSYTFTFQV